MANSNAYPFGTIFPFTLDVKNQSGMVTHNFQLSNLLWTVYFAKAEDFLQIWLSSSPNDTTPVWYCDAWAVFKLFHKNGEVGRTVVKSLNNYRFSHLKLSSENIAFIEWNELLNEYVDNQNQAKFEINLSTNPFKCIEPLKIHQTSTIFQFVLEKVSQLTSVDSSPVVLRDIKWWIHAQRISDRREEDYFALYLIADEEDLDKNWFWEVTASLKLLSANKNIDPVHYRFTENYQWGASRFGCKNLLPFSTLIKPGHYAVNDMVIFFIEFSVQTPQPLWKIEQI